jgi:hypothetical protein
MSIGSSAETSRRFLMASAPERMATIEDLYRVEGKAELIAGRIVRLPPFRVGAARAAGEISFSLHDHAEATGLGEAYGGTLV